MSFLNFPLLALGTLAVAGPIILHLMMQRKPKHIIFPALRFVQKKQVTNTRKLKLRQWALLGLRCAAVLGLGIALAKPVIASAGLGVFLLGGGLASFAIFVGALGIVAKQRGRGSFLPTILGGIAAALFLGALFIGWQAMTNDEARMPLGDSEAPVAAVMIIDTSPRMALVNEGESRLDEAKTLGKWLVRQLPMDSRVAIVDSRLGGSSFAIDRASAIGEIDVLTTGFQSQTVTRMIDAAKRLLANAEQEQREIYVIGDLTEPSWQGEITSADTEAADDENSPLVYLVDVGVEEPQNIAIGEIDFPQQHISANAKLPLTVSVQSQGLSASRNVELYVETNDPGLPIIVNGEPRLPEKQLRDQREVTLAQDETVSLEFSLRGLDVGTHHGELRLTGSDGLTSDDSRFFSIEVHPPWRILIAAGPGAEPRFVHELLAPYRYRETGQAMFQCDVIDAEDIESTELDEYAAIALLDPAPMTPVVWRTLADYVRRGHGLATFLGRNATVENFNTPEALEVLPGQIKRPWRAGADDILFAFGAEQHPILKILEPISTTIPWETFPIQKHWLVEKTSQSGRVIMRFSNGKPALLEGNIGSGQVVMATTPVSDPLNVRGRRPWNRGTDSWPYVVLVNEITRYLVQGADSRLNYSVGQTAYLPTTNADERYQLFLPGGSWQQAQSKIGNVAVPFTDTPGTYRLKPDDTTKPHRGFSVNLQADATNLNRIDASRLDKLFPDGNYQIARTKESIDRSIGVARRGHEFYPWVILFVALLLALEHLLSNLFYGQLTSDTSPSPTS